MAGRRRAGRGGVIKRKKMIYQNKNVNEKTLFFLFSLFFSEWISTRMRMRRIMMMAMMLAMKKTKKK